MMCAFHLPTFLMLLFLLAFILQLLSTLMQTCTADTMSQIDKCLREVSFEECLPCNLTLDRLILIDRK